LKPLIEDKKVFILLNPDICRNAGDYLSKLPPNGEYEVVFRKISANKTLKQLGALFGNWVKYIADNYGESQDLVHRRLKAKFMARIYITEPLTPEQESWVELLAIYQMAGDQEKLLKHARRISLKWARLPQMKEYMNAIESHYQAIGEPLPIIDKYHNEG